MIQKLQSLIQLVFVKIVASKTKWPLSCKQGAQSRGLWRNTYWLSQRK